MDEERVFLLKACVIIILLMFAAAAYSYKDFVSSVEGFGFIDVKEEGIKGVARFVYYNYTATFPSIDYRHYYGSENAPVTIIAFTDPSSEPSRAFMKGVFQKIKSEYLDSGKARFYPRFAIAEEDYAERNERFIYAQSFYCFRYLDRDKAFDFYLSLADMSDSSGIPEKVKEMNVSYESFSQCMKSQDFPEMSQDMFEMDRLGVTGLNQIFYIGMLGRDNHRISGGYDYDQFRRIIRTYQIGVGD